MIELGAGCALTGLVAAHIQSNNKSDDQHIFITDVNEAVLDNIQSNVLLNDASGCTSVNKLDFYSHDGSRDYDAWIEGEWRGSDECRRKQVDVVLGADVICCIEDAWATARTIRAALRPRGSCYLVSAESKSRFGVEVLEQACVENGLEVTVTSVRSMYDGRLYTKDLNTACGFDERMEFLFCRVTKLN